MARTQLPAAQKFYDAGCRFRRLKGEKGINFSISVHMQADDTHTGWWWSKPKRVQLSSPDNKTELLAYAEEYRDELLNREVTTPDVLTVSDYVQRFREYRQERVALGKLQASTVEREKVELSRIDEYLGSIPLSDLNSDTVADAYNRMARDGVSEYTQARTHAKLKKLLYRALRDGLVTVNAADDIEDAPKQPKINKDAEKERTVTIDEADALMQDLRTEPRDGLRAAVWLAYMMGLRRGEALGLRWDDIDLDTMTVHIVRQQSRNGIKNPKTYESKRDLPLEPTVWAYLEEWREIQQQIYKEGLPVRDKRGRFQMTTNSNGERVKMTKPTTWDGSVPVCTNRDGRAWDTANFNRALRIFFSEHNLGEFRGRTTFTASAKHADGSEMTASRRSDYHGATLHALRHTYATSLIRANADVKSVQYLMGHENVQTTLALYARETEEGMREAAAMHAKRLITPADEAEFDDELLKWMRENL